MKKKSENKPEEQFCATANLASKSIEDFGEQWAYFQNNPGYYGSVTLLADLFGPLLSLDSLRDRRIADIGSGTGRIVNMLLDAGASHVVAVEPSVAFSILQKNTEANAAKITYINARGEAIPPGLELDIVVSVGVLHHIPEPEAVVAAAYKALRPGGGIFVWLYGREGNELYLKFAEPIRRITKHLPHSLLMIMCTLLNVALDVYIFLCRFLPLPMRHYIVNVVARFSRPVRKLTIYDQLNPAYAKYYSQREAEALLEKAGFRNVSSWHRHGYSWSVVGQRPMT